MDLRYPIGKFEFDGEVDAPRRTDWIRQLEELPDHLEVAIRGLNDAQLDTRYRPEGWTVRQVVHHIPDSHMNAYIRVKWALTEDQPTLKAYDEVRWAELDEAKTGSLQMSLGLTRAVHVRWVACFRTLSDEQFGKRILHPESGMMRVDQLLGMYGWHGRHHVAHITSLRERMNW